MKKHCYFVFSALLLLVSQGCISHQFTVDFSKESPSLYYTAYGDTFDLYDHMLGFPSDSLKWEKIDESRHESEDGPYWSMSWEGKRTGQLLHPISPPEFEDLSQIQFIKLNRILYKESKFSMIFPTWDVDRKFGDLEAFIPSYEEYAKITGQTEPDYNQYELYKAVAMQKANVHRYLLQLQRIHNIWQEQNKTVIDSINKLDSYTSFRQALETYLESKNNLDPREVSLEWYSDLRAQLIDAACLACNNDSTWCSTISDSLQHEWNLWMDMKDDTFDLRVIMPSQFVSSNADSISGDTLFWQFEGEELANDTYLLEASGKTPVVWVIALSILVILGILILIIRRVK